MTISVATNRWKSSKALGLDSGSLSQTNPRITFSTLLKNYPKVRPKHINPDTNKDAFKNGCAINMSECLHRSGIKFITFSGRRCNDYSKYLKCPSGHNIHAIAAGELGNHWKGKVPFLGASSSEEYTGANYREKVLGRTGIIFFENYWNNENPITPDGDHIDLWNKRYTVSNDSYLESWFGADGNRDKATTVLFWEVN